MAFGFLIFATSLAGHGWKIQYLWNYGIMDEG